MNYTEAVDYIHSLLRFGSHLELDRICCLLEKAGNPQKKLKFVHVAGTNGKGSTSTYIATILTKAGYKTGIYISPHVLEFRERIQIDGEMIEKGALAEIATRVKNYSDEMSEYDEHCTEFEIVTAIALIYYAEQNCDFAVLEVGLGGRFDATNSIDDSLVQVITAIGYDHIEILGDTLAKIAFEKCGIIRPNRVVVSYPKQETEALDMIMSEAQKKNSTVIIPDLEYGVNEQTLEGTKISYHGLDIRIPLLGEHQIFNCITAIEAIQQIRKLGYQVSDSSIVDGISSTKFPARMEILRRNTLIILDGAHNPAGIATLRRSLDIYQISNVIAITGMLADKDIEGSLSQIAPVCKKIFTVAPNNNRAKSAEQLAEIIKPYCQDVTPCENCNQALELALPLCAEADTLLIFGSLYLASEIRSILVQ